MAGITRQQLCDFAVLCGQDPRRVRAMVYDGSDPRAVQFELSLVNESGYQYPAESGRWATEWVKVPLLEA